MSINLVPHLSPSERTIQASVLVWGHSQMGAVWSHNPVEPLASKLPGKDKYFSLCKGMCKSVWADLDCCWCFVISLLSQNIFPFQQYDALRALKGSSQPSLKFLAKEPRGTTASVTLFFLPLRPSALYLASPVDQSSTQILQVKVSKKQ